MQVARNAIGLCISKWILLRDWKLNRRNRPHKETNISLLFVVMIIAMKFSKHFRGLPKWTHALYCWRRNHRFHVIHAVTNSARVGHKQILDDQCPRVFTCCGVVACYNLRFLVFIKPLQVVQITLFVSLFVCLHTTVLGIYSIFYSNLHIWI